MRSIKRKNKEEIVNDLSLYELAKEFDILFNKDSLTKDEKDRLSDVEGELQKRQEIR